MGLFEMSCQEALRLRRLGPERAECMNLLENRILLAAGLGVGQLLLQLAHFFLAMIAAIQFRAAFDHVRDSVNVRLIKARYVMVLSSR